MGRASTSTLSVSYELASGEFEKMDIPTNRPRRRARFSLETLIAAVTLCGIEAALLRSNAPAAALPAAILGTVLLYVPMLWFLIHLDASERTRRALIAISGGIVVAIMLIFFTKSMR